MAREGIAPAEGQDWGWFELEVTPPIGAGLKGIRISP